MAESEQLDALDGRLSELGVLRGRLSLSEPPFISAAALEELIPLLFE